MGRREPNVKIIVGKDEPLEKALRKFKKLCERAGIKKEIKSRRYYEKPSAARRRLMRKARRNETKTERKANEYQQNRRNRNKSWSLVHPKLTDN